MQVDEREGEFIVSTLDAMHQLPAFNSLLRKQVDQGSKQAFKLSYLELG